jgi:hypothetical protein
LLTGVVTESAEEPRREDTIVSEHTFGEPIALPGEIGLSRRQFVAQTGVWAALALVATTPASVALAAQDATPVAADRLQALLDLSKTLCGGGNLDPDRVAMLYRYLTSDPELAAGLDELLASPPTEGAPIGSPHAHATAKAILIFWYVGALDGKPVSDRSTAYYGLTAWQAMYTPPWAICKAFGGWADPPRTGPLVPST